MHGTDVVFLGVSVDEAKDKQKWLDFIETEGLKGIQLLANGWSKITKDYKINGIPRFMVFDKKGNIVSADAPRPSNPELKKMLEAELNGEKFDCLNELALLHPVAPGKENKVVTISVTIDGSHAGEFVADGLIVATPTGSTAYSLSAGGSIMTPDCATFQLTPVCAFSMRSRPIAYSDRSELCFSLPQGALVLYGDGVYLGEAGAADRLVVRKSARSVTFLTRGLGEYFRRLTQKIN